MVEQPTPISMTEAMQEAYAYAGDDVFFDTLKFEVDGQDPLMVVNSGAPLETPQGTYLAGPFDLRLPETEGEIVAAMEIEVRFLPRAARTWLMEASRARLRIRVTWLQYLGPDQDPDAFFPLPLDVSSVECSETGATATATFRDLVNMPFPRRIMLARDLPGAVS